jgi:hypothetical protein
MSILRFFFINTLIRTFDDTNFTHNLILVQIYIDTPNDAYQIFL